MAARRSFRGADNRPLLEELESRLLLSAVTIADVPSYIWYNGCGPTAEGMIIGYWDAHGYGNLIHGSNDWSTNQQAVKDMIASPGQIRDYAVTPDRVATVADPYHADDSVADFSWTSRDWTGHTTAFGWSSFGMQPQGLLGYAAFKGYTGFDSLTATYYDDSFWTAYISEILAERPVELAVDSDADGLPDHFVTGIGFDNSTSTLKYACYNTWDQSVHWYDVGFCSHSKAYGVYGATFLTPGEPDSGNQAPTDISLSASSIAENQPAGTTVGTFSTTDPDTGDTFTYSLVSGTGSADNASFTIAGDQLKTAASFDYEAKNSYSIRVRTTDSGPGNLTYEKMLAISVTDVNEAPVVTTTTPLSYPVTLTWALVDSGITVTDADSANLVSAVVRITGNYVAGQDYLDVTPQGGITDTYDVATGTLTMTGSALVSTWQAELRAVAYINVSRTPNKAQRTVTFTANDGQVNSNPATRAINITTNDPPVVTTTPTPLSYPVTLTWALVDSGITVSDADSANLVSAVARITSNYVVGQDYLDVTPQGGITDTWDAATGTLAMTATTTTALGTWQAELRAVAYINCSATPNKAQRTVTFTANDAQVNSSPATRAINIMTNNPPVVTPTASPLVYQPTLTWALVDSGIQVSDADSANLTRAVVQISDNYVMGQDYLDVTPQGGITDTYDAATGTLTMTGSALLSTWQAELRAVAYINGSAIPNKLRRTLTFVANDGQVNSATTMRQMYVTPGTSPVVTTTPSAVQYPAPVTWVRVDSGAAVFDPDSMNLVSAQVRITGNYVAGQDFLDVTPQGGITDTFDVSTGTLTMTATTTASVATWQGELRAVAYINSSGTPSTAARTVTFTASDGTTNSDPATRRINIAPDVRPVFRTTPAALTYPSSLVWARVDSQITVADTDSPTWTRVTVRITGNYVAGQDYLDVTPRGGITDTFDMATGTLTMTATGTMSGTASLATWQAELRAVAYINVSATPNKLQRTLTFTANDGLLDSLVATRTITLL